MKELVQIILNIVAEIFKTLYEIVKPILLLPLSWAFSFTDSQEQRIENLFKDNSDELWTWTLLTALLPLLTFFLSAFVNAFFIDYTIDVVPQMGKILNNGSLPIIAFGIVTSSIPYLVEKLKMEKEDEEDDIFSIRKRTMAVATVLIFLTSGVFLLQSIIIVTDKFNAVHHLIVLSFSGLLTIYAVGVGRKMFVLQSAKITPTVDEKLMEGTQQHTNSLESRYGD